MDFNKTTGLLPGQSAPLSTITSTDQSGVVLIATALGLAFALVSLLIRVYVQMGLRAAADFSAVLSMVFYVFQGVATFVDTSVGFRETIDEIPAGELVPMQKAIYASELLYLITLWPSKCSVAFLFIRLSPVKRHNLASYSILGLSTIFMFISVLIISLRCEVAQPWIYIAASCSHFYARWQTVAAMDIITEIALFSTSIYLIKNLQLCLQKKCVVVLAFGLHLPMVIPTILRLNNILSSLGSTDPSLEGAMVQVYTQIELCYAIIAATTPCLRPFMKALSTHYGAPASMKSTPKTTHSYT
ncbi:hypothetical protein IFR04_011053 [Cadophora malorum]|uniref:Rhodopsin domain-containing protein n=1 Tax=Cadophora malorum TaxID=108018 RepID=A0A8H7T620_9HELO|nr:hypothetical protein IFR04_011053 [Cadophora malorum]